MPTSPPLSRQPVEAGRRPPAPRRPDLPPRIPAVVLERDELERGGWEHIPVRRAGCPGPGRRVTERA